ncbi:MAG: 7-carboxy-7-deazaguanine synthase QueE [Bacteroidota bacterium]|jgi:7-carboxy-7-deazaguanine synthase|nr:7-carboxy-7-deazaguanine synthase QueE [Bacteroidota bacterium]MEC8758249.1 7-carboxy-7-deazaguanine synthase QueE [Bacteroidota bacterium]
MTATTTYPVMEAFATVQGEGAHTGTPSWFIRLGGCDVGCVWCDVKESWDADAHPRQSVEELVAAAVDSGRKTVVVTGGEPAMHNLAPLTDALRAAGLTAHIETSGAHPLTGTWDWVTLSPKKFKACREDVYPLADELKVVVFHRSDMDWAAEHAEHVREDCGLFLQPEWDRRDDATFWILSWIAARPGWRISLQTHKYIGIP